MKDMKRIVISIIWIMIGGILIGLSILEKVDAFWSGMGSALLTVGTIQILRFWRLKTNELYREKIEIEESDERNHFIRNKAWAWAGYMFVMIAAVASIVFKIFNQEVFSIIASGAVGLMIVLFWIMYFILKRKY